MRRGAIGAGVFDRDHIIDAMQPTPGSEPKPWWIEANATLAALTRGMNKASGYFEDDSNRIQSNAYNKYFSGGMSSIVFQEIREFRSLAYSSWASYNTPWHNNKEGNFMGYVGCQADKTLEAILVFKDIKDSFL